MQPRTPLHARHRDQHQGVLPAAPAPAVHAGPREAGRRSHHAGAGRSRLRAPAAASTAAAGRRAPPLAPADPAVLLMSGGTTGTPKGVLGTHGAYVMAGLQIKAWNAIGARRRATTSSSCRCRCFTSTRTSACRRWRSSPATRSRSCRTRATSPICSRPIRRVKPAFFNGVPTLYIALLNHPDVQQRQGRLQVDQDLLLRRRAAAGRHQDALRSAHRRPHRRRLLADRSDDGAVRQPGEGPEQARLGRHAAARRRRPHLRRRRGHARAAAERGRRDLLSRRRS